MRTTLELDDHLVAAAKKIARERGQTLGRVVSDLARQTLAIHEEPEVRNGMPLLKRRPGSPSVTMEMVNALRDQD